MGDKVNENNTHNTAVGCLKDGMGAWDDLPNHPILIAIAFYIFINSIHVMGS
eukprot:COSAG01_NODE_58799_length_303_cov_42.813725_1_plen_51_part_10